MEKKKKTSKLKVFGVKLNALFRLGTIVAACVGVYMYLDERFDNIEQTMDRKFEQVDRRFEQVDRRFEQVDRRLDGIDSRLNKIEVDLKKTGDLLDTYLAWRFIYVNDPARKDLVPIYDPLTGTLNFVDRKNSGK